MGKESASNAGYIGRHKSDPQVGKMPWRRVWQPTPIFLPGESHGQRSLVGYSPWGREELDTTERLHVHKVCLTTPESWLCYGFSDSKG